jgi:hypothetical protein
MLTGTAAVDDFLTHAATLGDFGTEAVTLPGCEILQTLFEIRIGGRQASLPAGLHPTNPPTFVAQIWRCPDSPWGPFSLAQARVGCRSGLRPRGFVQGTVCDNEAAAEALRVRWGFPTRVGAVTLRRQYDATYACVALADHVVFELMSFDPEPLGPDDVSYSTAANLARTPRGLRLVQVDIDVHVTRAERVKPRLAQFDGPAWGVHPTVLPYHPVSATTTVGDITIQRLRYVSKPDELAFTSTESL